MQLKFKLFEDMERQPTPVGVRDKKCSNCEVVFPETENYFYAVNVYYSKDGTSNMHLHNKCKSCSNKARTIQKQLCKIHGHKAFGKCDCCGVDAKELKGDKLHLDHCHKTGTYRGHLCSSCNRGMGMLGDDSEGVQRAIDYLKKVENKE